jgi:hypothetical protein
MKPNNIDRPVLRKTAARAFYLRIAAEWMTGKRRVPSAVLADAEQAARGVLVRHACQPKAHIKLPAPERGGASLSTNTPT